MTSNITIKTYAQELVNFVDQNHKEHHCQTKIQNRLQTLKGCYSFSVQALLEANPAKHLSFKTYKHVFASES